MHTGKTLKFCLKSLPKYGLLLKERICSLWEQILSFKSSPYGKEANYCMLMSLCCKYFFLTHVTHILNVHNDAMPIYREYLRGLDILPREVTVKNLLCLPYVKRSTLT